MADENGQAEDGDDHEEGCDDLCDAHVTLEADEITDDSDLPAATGGVERPAG